VGHPFDTIKTKMQAQEGFLKGPGMVSSFSTVLKTQGLPGLYKVRKRAGWRGVLLRRDGGRERMRGCKVEDSMKIIYLQPKCLCQTLVREVLTGDTPKRRIPTKIHRSSSFFLPFLPPFLAQGALPPLLGSGIYRSTQFAVFEALYTKWDDEVGGRGRAGGREGGRGGNQKMRGSVREKRLRIDAGHKESMLLSTGALPLELTCISFSSFPPSVFLVCRWAGKRSPTRTGCKCGWWEQQ